jgi:hypothetical protein
MSCHVIPLGTGFPLCRLLRLTGLWWRYSNPPPHGDETCCLISLGGNHPVNYKECTVYKDLQKKTYPPLHSKIYTPTAQIKQNQYTQQGVTYAQVTKQKSHAPANIEQKSHINPSHQQTRDT